MANGKYLGGASRRSLLQQFGAAAIGISFSGGLSACGQGGGGRSINLYNWDTYIGEHTLADFQEATGINVEMSLFSNNDELFARLRAGNPGYDVIVPSNEYVTRMAEAQMIQQLDHALIPNMANLLPDFQDAAYDPGRRYSMPYAWTALGLGYRKSAYPTPPTSWRAVFEDRTHTQKIALIGESADLIRLAAKYKGHSVNGIPEAMLADIERMLIAQKPQVKAFHEDDGQDLLVSGEVDIVIEYNGDIAQIMSAEGGDQFGFVIPTEGTLLNNDCLCIPTGAPNAPDAHAFINYCLDGEAGKHISETILYPTPNRAARDLMPDSYKNNPVIFPPPEAMSVSEYGAYEGDEKARQYEEIFTRVSAA